DDHRVAPVDAQQIVGQAETVGVDGPGPGADAVEFEGQVVGGDVGGPDTVGEGLVGLGQRLHGPGEVLGAGGRAGVFDPVTGLVHHPAPERGEVPAHAVDAFAQAYVRGDLGGEGGGDLLFEGGQSGVAETAQGADDAGVAGAAGGAELLGVG